MASRWRRRRRRRDASTYRSPSAQDRNAIVNDNPNERILKPPPAFAGDSELQALANVIQREIYAPTSVEGDGWGELWVSTPPKVY